MRGKICTIWKKVVERRSRSDSEAFYSWTAGHHIPYLQAPLDWFLLLFINSNEGSVFGDNATLTAKLYHLVFHSHLTRLLLQKQISDECFASEMVDGRNTKGETSTFSKRLQFHLKNVLDRLSQEMALEGHCGLIPTQFCLSAALQEGIHNGALPDEDGRNHGGGNSGTVPRRKVKSDTCTCHCWLQGMLQGTNHLQDVCVGGGGGGGGRKGDMCLLQHGHFL